MDTITQLTNKIMAERAHQPVIHQAIDTAPPPPYTESTSDSDDDSDDEAPQLPQVYARPKPSHGALAAANLAFAR